MTSWRSRPVGFLRAYLRDVFGNRIVVALGGISLAAWVYSLFFEWPSNLPSWATAEHLIVAVVLAAHIRAYHKLWSDRSARVLSATVTYTSRPVVHPIVLQAVGVALELVVTNTGAEPLRVCRIRWESLTSPDVPASALHWFRPWCVEWAAEATDEIGPGDTRVAEIIEQDELQGLNATIRCPYFGSPVSMRHGHYVAGIVVEAEGCRSLQREVRFHWLEQDLAFE